MRIGYDRSLDLAVSALLAAQNFVEYGGSVARAASIRFYVDAIDSIQAVLSGKSFWTSEEAQLAVGILSAYESIKGMSLNYT